MATTCDTDYSNDPLFTVDEVCGKLAVGKARIHQLVHEGKMTGVHVDRRLMIPQSQVDAYQQTRRKYRRPNYFRNPPTVL